MKKLLTIAFILVSLFSFGQTIDLGKYTTFGTITADYGVFDSIDVGVAVIDTTRALQTIQVDTVEEYTSGNGVYFKDATRFGNNMTVDGYIYQNDPGTTANSFLFLQSADSGGTVQSSSIQTMFGADPYVQFKAPNNVGLATTALNLYDDKADFFDEVKTDTLAEHTAAAGIYVKDRTDFADSVTIASGQKLFFDGGGNTYQIGSSNSISIYAGGILNTLHQNSTTKFFGSIYGSSDGGQNLGLSSINWGIIYTKASINNGATEMIDFSTATKVETKVKTVYSPSADQSLLATDSLVVTKRIMRVVGNGGAVTIGDTPSIAIAGMTDGTEFIIQGTSDVNTVTFQDEANLAGSKLQLAGGVDFTMGQGDVLHLMYDAGDGNFYEISRSDN